MKYRKTALIEAEQFDGSDEMIEKYEIEKLASTIAVRDGYYKDFNYQFETIEGTISFDIGDWIATGVNGEHWPIADDVFKKTYEAVKFGCNYCRRAKPLMQTESGTLMLIDNKLIEYVTWDDYNDCHSDKVNEHEINYCPMCGRKLGE